MSETQYSERVADRSAPTCSVGDYIIVKTKDGKTSSATSPTHIGATAAELMDEAFDTAERIGGTVVIVTKS